MFVSASDIPALLVPETKKARLERIRDAAGEAAVEQVLRSIKRKRKLAKKPLR
jgi:hypothetical protein